MTDKTMFFQGVLDSLDCGVSVYDDKGNFLFVNNALLKNTGTSRKDYQKRSAYDLLAEGAIDRCIADMVYKSRREACILQNVVNAKGSYQQLITAQPIFGPDGKVEYVVCWMQNLADYEKKLQRAKAESASTLRTTGSGDINAMIAQSPAMRSLLQIADNVAAVDSNVLLLGESGSGKDVMARYIHNHSPRAAKKMVVVNCASLPENLLESELFGYEKGAFTGAALQGKRGLVEEADGGTLFLDEINSLPLGLQAKLLRVLETKTIQPLGSVKSRQVDFRLITATNMDLATAVSAGAFRADLYYRLNVIPLSLPPLRERPEDIEILAQNFLDYFANKYDREKEFSPEVFAELRAYPWPGNVRELRNFVERMVVISSPKVRVLNRVPEGALTPPAPPTPAPAADIRNSRKQQEKELIEKALAESNGRRGRAAEALGISRRSLQYKLKEYGLIKGDNDCGND